jgi:histidine transport system permease protein/arginine/ornithine transport system permease protein
LKTTALVSVLGLHELVWESFTAGRSTRQLFSFFFVTLIIYLMLTAISDIGIRWLDKRYSVGVRRA